MKQVGKQLQLLLEQERECFRNILEESERFLTQFDWKSISAITKLLNCRQRWIEEIKNLEGKRLELLEFYPGYERYADQIQSEISELAQTLVEIDARILDILNNCKMKYVKEMTGIADRQQSRSGMTSTSKQPPKIINVLK